MTRALVSVVTAVLLFATGISAAEWGIDKAHSSIGFSVRHMVVSKTRGEFKDFTGKVQFDKDNLAKGTAQFTIQAASINTDEPERDKHLKSSDFLDVEQFPTITFVSKKVIPGKGNDFSLVGDLTIKGITKEVTFDCEFSGIVDDPWGNTRAGFSAETTINRKDFNVKWSKKLDNGGLVVGNDVDISLEIELIKKK